MDKTFCIFGDSVVQAAYVKNSWVKLLTEYLENKYAADFINLFNLGIGGNTSTDILKRFRAEAEVREASDFIFAFGVNDSGYLMTTDKPIVEEYIFIKNIEELITQAEQMSKNITFVGPVVGDDSLLKPFPGSTQGKAYEYSRVENYDRILKETAEGQSCRFIELLDKLDSSDFLDGLHPNEQGHRKMFEVIKGYF